jgi:hypothetical protein
MQLAKFVGYRTFLAHKVWLVVSLSILHLERVISSPSDRCFHDFASFECDYSLPGLSWCVFPLPSPLAFTLPFPRTIHRSRTQFTGHEHFDDASRLAT